MAALTADRNTPTRAGNITVGQLAAAVKVYAGAILMRNAAGYLVPATTATGLVGVGRAEQQVDNTSGSAGDLTVNFRPGAFRYANSAGGDELTIADIGTACYAVDDQTVAKTSDTSSRSLAGILVDVDDLGVWVDFNEALTPVAVAADA